jgi:predicted ABC-type transport system involved in lysophospholipase L1 biosynthesis ATPase subunit
VILAGEDAWSLPARRRAELRNRHIGFVFQFYHLLPELDAVENVMLPGMIARTGPRFRRRVGRERARELLTRFGLDERLEHRPSQLSGGERQRVAIARALFLDPEVLIADEPTGNLDTQTGDRVLDLLLAEQETRGLALLLVTHDERIAARCERTLTMEDGLIQADSAHPVPE